MKRNIVLIVIFVSAVMGSFGAGWQCNPKNKIKVKKITHIEGAQKTELGKICELPQGY